MYKYKILQAGQLPQENLSLTKLAEFYYHKYLKQVINDDLNICVDEHSPCCLSITGDISL